MFIVMMIPTQIVIIMMVMIMTNMMMMLSIIARWLTLGSVLTRSVYHETIVADLISFGLFLRMWSATY